MPDRPFTAPAGGALDPPCSDAPASDRRLRLTILGAVQGVGFRPFVWRLATGLGLRGWVRNSMSGVTVEVEGPRPALDAFLDRIVRERPPRASIQSLEPVFLDPAGGRAFEVLESATAGAASALVLPDIATCPDCLREVLDPSDRRHLYPFTNCTNCGPRYSIIEALPYDRSRTTMRRFEMCADCRREYGDPADRRFHAEPNACPVCGPSLRLLDPRGRVLAERMDALSAAASRVRGGEIVAVKGLGGFHLVVDASNDGSVRRLRERKRREEKPFALMFPSLDALLRECEVSPAEERLLLSPEAPIVLLGRRRAAAERGAGGDRGAGTAAGVPSAVAASAAPGNPCLGAMLPYTPLHHLLLHEVGSPVVATSGNASDEPICTDEDEALDRLGGIADAFLVHDRPIARHVDDSIARVVAGRELVLRRARGYAPLPIPAGERLPTILAVGAHLKSAVALALGERVFVSQHIGDLETAEADRAFRAVTESLRTLYGARPSAVACDAHPDYASSRHAAAMGLPVARIQHHHAHVVSCMAENELEGTVLGVSWDGTGLGTDGTIWGGEFLVATRGSFARFAHLRTFRLPGGEAAVREPRRCALGLLHELFPDPSREARRSPAIEAFSGGELALLVSMLRSGVNSPVTSSAGRLFDAVASLVGLRQRTRHEGQAAMELEFAASGAAGGRRYHLPVRDAADGPLVVDWEDAVREILEDRSASVAAGEVARGFHDGLVEAIVEVARRAGQDRVVLTGGCFQNKYLTEAAALRLERAGFRPYWHQRVPPNDGGIALGQAVAAGRMATFDEGRK